MIFSPWLRGRIEAVWIDYDTEAVSYLGGGAL